MAAEYAILIIIFSIILYTRKFPKLEEALDQMPMDEIINRSQPAINIRSPSREQSRDREFSPIGSQFSNRPASSNQLRIPGQNSRTPSRQSQNGYRDRSASPNNPPQRRSVSPNNQLRPVRPNGAGMGSAGGSRAPSVAGSVDGYRKQQSGAGGAFRPQRPTMLANTPPKRPGSVTGSIEGRLATSTPTERRPKFSQQMMPSSSPIHEADEDMDLWEAASLDYPGRNSPGNGWEFMEEEDEEDLIFYDEPR